MKLQLRKAFVCLLVLGSALLLMGASTDGEPQAAPVPEPFPSKVVWTPDGKHIIFSRGFQGIFRVDVAGSELRLIPENAPLGTAASPGYALPALSPDGIRLAFVARPSGLAQSATIMVSALDGTGARRLTQDEKFNTHPAWSPNGEEIAYISDGKLTVMRADGTSVRVLALSVKVLNAAPAWSPNGSRIAFVGVQDDTEYLNAVYAVRPDGTELTNLGPTVSVPTWSPDGSRIAFLMPEDHDEASLFTLDNKGNDPQKVWSLGQVNVRRAWSLVQTHRWYGNLSWSPDGSAILYVSDDGEVEVVSLDYANEMLRFDFGETSGTTPQKGLPGGTLAHAPGRWTAWSPDGNRIAVLSSLYQDNLSDPAHVDELYTMAQDAALARVLVQRDGTSLVAKHLGWYDTARNIAACADGFVVSNPEKNPGLMQDCEILMAIRDELAGDFLLNWSPAVPIVEWLGVIVSDVHPLRSGRDKMRVRMLYLRGRGILDDFYARRQVSFFSSAHKRFDVPGPLGWSEAVDIGLRGLSGSIPWESSKLSELILVELSHNSLSGSIPPELAELSGLMQLDIGHNNLSGSIPPEFSTFSYLVQLDLSHNGLTGSIPPGLENSGPLDVLDLGHNMLSGNIPSGLRAGQRLDLSHNSLTGSIPAELGMLHRLLDLDLSHNMLSGSIPPELGNASLRILNLSHNKLSGSIPQELARVATNSIRLHGNSLTGCMPRAWKDSLASSSDGIHDELEFCAE